MRANVQLGKFVDSGYRYVEYLDMSIQGVDANSAWAYSLHLATELLLPVQAHVILAGKRSVDGKDRILEWLPANT